jgi:hypothetical protein
MSQKLNKFELRILGALLDPQIQKQMDLMNAGSYFARYQLDEQTRTVSKNRIYLRYALPSADDEMGTLWWGPSREVTPTENLPLAAVASITPGKQSVELMSAMAKKTDERYRPLIPFPVRPRFLGFFNSPV